MVLIDTSVWIQLYRKKTTTLGELLWALAAKNEAAVCGQIWVEFLGGFKKELERKRFEKSLQAFRFLETTFAAYQLASDLAAQYPQLGASDAIIAATAMTQNCSLLTLDRDFKPLQARGLAIVSGIGDLHQKS